MVEDKFIGVRKENAVNWYYCPDNNRRPGPQYKSVYVTMYGRGHGRIPPGRKIILSPQYETRVLDG